ncbi:MAG TPA: DNA recombination protein RmuC [Acidimicrobiales bacterium]|nr:DNA recombination protein RmuC [Acidimicrobiales bacterium]
MSEGLVIGLVLGVLLGAAIAWVVRMRRDAGLTVQARTAEARLTDAQAVVAAQTAQLAASHGTLSEARADQARLSAEVEQLRTALHERAALIEQDREALIGRFAELSGDALRQNSEHFLTLADTRLREAHESARGELGQRQEAIATLLQPLQDTLTRYEQGLRQLELDRQGAYSGLTNQVRQLSASQETLQKETRNLVTALRAPQTRGRWGELQLKNVVEMSGMVLHCDFEEQVTTNSDEGRLRPDMVVNLAGGGRIVIDAKVPLDAYLRAIEADDEPTREIHLVTHARQLRTHVDQLAKKEYWQQFDRSPELVVAFVPGDPLLAAALEHDQELMEHGFASGVVLATPTSLIALLRTIALGWQEKALAENARAVQELGSELYDRLRVLGGHLAKVHKNLSGTVEAFNDAVGSLESRVLVSARRFPDLGVVGHGAKDLPELHPVTSTPRLPQAPELLVDVVEDQPFRRPALVVDVAVETVDPDELPGLSGTG